MESAEYQALSPRSGRHNLQHLPVKAIFLHPLDHRAREILTAPQSSQRRCRVARRRRSLGGLSLGFRLFRLTVPQYATLPEFLRVRVEGLPSSGNPTPTEPSVRISRTGLFSDRFTE